jgi:hypothetical protein
MKQKLKKVWSTDAAPPVTVEIDVDLDLDTTISKSTSM